MDTITLEKPNPTVAELKGLIGKEIAVSDWVTIDEARIDAFADCANDHQWVHTDPDRATTESPLGTTIAHGFLTLSLLTELQRDAGAWPLDAASIVNYGLEGQKKPALVAGSLRMMFTERAEETR